MLKLDHLLYAVPDLDDGIAFFEGLSGVAVARGGSHPGLGTRNALASFGDGVYLELIAPDPAQSLTGNLGGHIASQAAPGLLTFAVGASGLEAVAAKSAAAGLACQAPAGGARAKPDGSMIRWRTLHTEGADFGYWMPFFIDWLDTTHPSKTAPGGLQLLDFEIAHPRADALRAIYRSLDIDVRVVAGDRPGMRALLRGAKQELVLSGLA